jgi:hypothetical protein
MVAMLSAKNVLYRPRGSGGGGGFMDSSNTNQMVALTAVFHKRSLIC